MPEMIGAWLMTRRYGLPVLVAGLLSLRLGGRKNWESILALATLIGRYQARYIRLGKPFELSWRGLLRLATKHGLDLSERKIKSATKALKEAGFVERIAPDQDKRPIYKRELREPRSPRVFFRFGPDFAAYFPARFLPVPKDRRGLSGRTPALGTVRQRAVPDIRDRVGLRSAAEPSDGLRAALERLGANVKAHAGTPPPQSPPTTPQANPHTPQPRPNGHGSS